VSGAVRRTAEPLAFAGGAAIGALAAVLAVFVWGLAATVIGVRDNTMPLGLAALAGLVQGLAHVWLLGRGVGERRATGATWAAGLALFILISAGRPFGLPLTDWLWSAGGGVIALGAAARMIEAGLTGINLVRFSRIQAETLLIRALRGTGYAFFILSVTLPFYVMVVASLKKQADFITNPLDLSVDLTRIFSGLFASYGEVLVTFHFARYVGVSTLVSLLTVAITLIFAIPGAYAVSRLRFPGRALLSNSILLIYLFPAIVLVIPLYSVFSQIGLRDSLLGLLVVYPATTLPVSLYMLQGYFRTLPSELEEAGLIDGCSRVAVIWRITLPLSLPAVASVALYVFMIAWNEFLFAFMFLDTPAIFTLSRGLVSLNNSEVPRQFLMAGAVIVTVPVMALFLWMERFMVAGLTAGSVKG